MSLSKTTRGIVKNPGKDFYKSANSSLLKHSSESKEKGQDLEGNLLLTKAYASK